MNDIEREFTDMLSPLPKEFQDAGLVLTKVESDPVPVRDWIHHHFYFVNPSSHAKMEIILRTEPTGLVGFITFINDASELGGTHRFDLRTYFQNYGREAEVLALYQGKEEAPKLYLKRYLDWLRGLVAGEFKPIFEGKTLVNIVFDYKDLG